MIIPRQVELFTGARPRPRDITPNSWKTTLRQGVVHGPSSGYVHDHPDWESIERGRSTPTARAARELLRRKRRVSRPPCEI